MRGPSNTVFEPTPKQGQQCLEEIVAYARQHVPYYRDLLERTGQFEMLPPLTKAIIREQFERL